MPGRTRGPIVDDSSLHADGREPPQKEGTMKVADVMTRDVVTVEAGASLKDAARLLAANRISGLPVVTSDGTVLGIVSEADVIAKEHELAGNAPRAADHPLHDARVVGEAMTAPALTIEPNRRVSFAAALMSEHDVNRLPVVEDAKLVGIVTRADLVRAFIRTDAEIAQEIHEDVVERSMRIDPADVQVEVDGGEVTLRGRVGSHADAELLPTLVGRVPGVVTVHSNLGWAKDEQDA
jgi:CBS domain-containing protein